METEKFESWAIVELMGHQKIAGKITEQNIAGTCLLRVDVPENDTVPAFTKLFGSSAIYAISLVDQETATVVAKNIKQTPMGVWEIREMIKRNQLQLTDKDWDEDEELRKDLEGESDDDQYSDKPFEW